MAFALVAVSVVVPADPGAQLISTVGLVLLPGMVLESLIMPSALPELRKLLIAAGVGITTFCLVGAIAGAVGPLLGIERPLGRLPLLVLWLVILTLLWSVAVRRRLDPVGSAASALSCRDHCWVLALALPPCVALVGATRLNATGSNSIAIVATALGLGLVFATVALGQRVRESAQAALLASAVVTLVWQLPTRGGWLWGSDIQHEYSVAAATVASGRFPLPHSPDPYAGMLTLTVLPAQLHFLNAMQLRTIFVLLPGVMLAACAVTALTTMRRIAGPSYASFLAAVMVIGSASFLTELPTLLRQCVALFLFALVVQLIAQPTASINRVRFVTVIVGIGLAVSHYTTAYLGAAAVLVAWLLGVALRSERSRRVITAPVAALFAGSAITWGIFVAHTSLNLAQVANSIRLSGLQILPGGGDLLTRWIEGTAFGKSVSATHIRALDIAALRKRYDWMRVDPRASSVHLMNSVTSDSHGVSILGPIVQGGETIVREALLLAVIVAVAWIVSRALKQRVRVELLGLALFFLICTALFRISGTLALEFNPERSEIQAYLVFVVVLAYLLQYLRVRLPPVAPSFLAVLATLQVAFAFGLGSYVIADSDFPATLTATGNQINLFAVTPADRNAASWLLRHSGTGVIQADPYSALALADVDGGYRKNVILTVDPIVVDDSAWVFATSANVLSHTARAAVGADSGSFVFPSGYFGRTRSILYVSGSDIIYGSDPS